MSNILNALNQQSQEFEDRQNNINQKVRDFDLEESIKKQGIEQLKNQMGAQKFEAAMGLVPLAARVGEMSGASKYVKGKYDSAKDYVLGKKQDAEANLEEPQSQNKLVQPYGGSELKDYHDDMGIKPIRPKTNIDYVYRLDRRGPEEIAKEGFTGSPNAQEGSPNMVRNALFGKDTVFTAKTKEGVLAYAKEHHAIPRAKGVIGHVEGDANQSFGDNWTGHIYKIPVKGKDTISYSDYADSSQPNFEDFHKTASTFDPAGGQRGFVTTPSVDWSKRYANSTAASNEEVQVRGPLNENIEHVGTYKYIKSQDSSTGRRVRQRPGFEKDGSSFDEFETPRKLSSPEKSINQVKRAVSPVEESSDKFQDLSTTIDTTDFDKLSSKKIGKLPSKATDEDGIPIFDKPTPEQLKTGISTGRFKVTKEGIEDNLTGGSTKFGLKGGAKFFSPEDLRNVGLNIKPGGDIRQEFQRQRDIESGRTYARANQPPKITEDEDKFTMVGEPSEEFKKAFPLSEGSVGTSADLSFRIKNPIQPQEQIKAGEERTSVFRAKGKVIRPEDIAESAPIPEVRGLNLSEKQAPITSELTRDERQRGAYGSGQGTAFERAPIGPEDQSMLNRLESGAQQAQNLTKKSLELPSQQREPTLISKQSLDNIAEKSEPAEEGEEGEVAEKEVAEESGSKLGGAALMGLSALGTIGDSSKSAGQKVGDIGKQAAMFGGIEAAEALVPGLGDVALAGTAIYELTHVAHEEKELRQQQEQISQAPAPTGSGGSSGSAPVIDSSSYHIL